MGNRFIEPTIFTNVENHMRIAQEEVFGPILSIIPFEDEADALSIGNDCLWYAAGVWTADIGRALRMSEKLKGRHGLGQHLPGGEFHVTFWRLQAVRTRT